MHQISRERAWCHAASACAADGHFGETNPSVAGVSVSSMRETGQVVDRIFCTTVMYATCKQRYTQISAFWNSCASTLVFRFCSFPSQVFSRTSLVLHIGFR
jgi:hypothetical protein